MVLRSASGKSDLRPLFRMRSRSFLYLDNRYRKRVDLGTAGVGHIATSLKKIASLQRSEMFFRLPNVSLPRSLEVGLARSWSQDVPDHDTSI